MKAIAATLLTFAATVALAERAPAQQPPGGVRLPAVQTHAANAKTLTGKVVSINRDNHTIVVQGGDDGGDKGGGKPPKLILDIAQLPAASVANLHVGDRISVQYSVLNARYVARGLQMAGPIGPRP
jgi:hypothetical protein